MAVVAVGQGGNMFFRHHQQMHRRCRINVMKDNQMIVFKDFF